MTAMLLNPEQFRAHVETALTDDAIQQLLDANEDVINEWAGPLVFDPYEEVVESVTETVYAREQTLLPLNQEPAEIVSVNDFHSAAFRTIDADGYRIRGHYLERAQLGVPMAFPPIEDMGAGWPAWPAAYSQNDPLWKGNVWGDRTVVEYIPKNSLARRIATLIQLCKLSMNFEPGLHSSSAGPTEERYTSGMGWGDFLTQRTEILRSLKEPELFG